MAIPTMKQGDKLVKKSQASKQEGELVVSRHGSSPKPISKKRFEKTIELGRENQDALDRELDRLSKINVAPQEKDYIEEYVHTYKSLKKIIRIKEAQVIEGGANQRDVYALSMLYSQMREVIADMRTIADMTQQTNILVERVLIPYKSDIVQVVTDVYYQLRKLMVEVSKPEQVPFAHSKLDDLIRDLAKAVQANSDVAIQRVSEILNGPPEDEKKRKKKRPNGV